MAARTLRVLYLTPPPSSGDRLAAQSFVEEEIREIRNCAVVPYVLTDAAAESRSVDGIHMEGLRRGTLPALAGPALVGFQHAAVIGRVARASATWSEVVHAVRLEEAAARLVRRESIDVIHSHFGWPGGFGGSLAAARTQRPLVASIRGTDVLVRPAIAYGLRLDPAYDAALRHLLANASAILTATTFMRGQTLALDAPPERVRVIDKGVDTRRFRPPPDRQAIKSDLGITGPMVLAVGALKKRKGLDVIIEAMSRLDETPTLAICGSGEERDALHLLAQARGVAARVRFVGDIDRRVIPAYFAAADVFVHAAELEAAGNVVLEALSSGCAVVVTDSGGPGEYVEDGVNGFVVPVGDVDALTDRLRALTSSVDLRQRFGREARRRVEERHEYGRMMSDIRHVYDDVVSKPNARVRARVPPRPPADQGGTARSSPRHSA